MTTKYLLVQQQTGIKVKAIVKIQILRKIMRFNVCELSKDTTTETGMWTNIFRVEISAHVDYGNSINIIYFVVMG